jgi:hypothetical protein
MSVLANSIGVEQDAVCYSARSALECDKTRISSKRIYRRDRLHSAFALSADSLVAPHRSLLDAQRISDPISGRIKTDGKQIQDEMSYGRLRTRTKHDVLNPTQSDSRLFSLYSFLHADYQLASV